MIGQKDPNLTTAFMPCPSWYRSQLLSPAKMSIVVFISNKAAIPFRIAKYVNDRMTIRMPKKLPKIDWY
jgi:hypothetical protein